MKQSSRADAMYAQSAIRLSAFDREVMQEIGRRLRLSLGEVVRTAALPSIGLGSPQQAAMHELVCRTAREVLAERQTAA